VDIFTEIKQSARLTMEKKRVVPIGIYGSFQPRNIGYLKALRDFLLYHGYLAYLSLDLQRLCPRQGYLGDNEYNLRVSRLMATITQVQIVFIFNEAEGEHNVNQSASIELDQLLTGRQKHVMIFFEEGSLEQSCSLFKGLLEYNISSWAHDSFTRQENNGVEFVNPALLNTGLMFCYNRILSDPSLGYGSTEQIERLIDQAWSEKIN
jgi:hypothetical protein